MDDLELIKMRLSRMPLEGLVDLSKESGVPYGTLWHMKTRNTKNPRYKTVRKLVEYFKRAA